MTTPTVNLHRIAASVRLLQGYRFLDRCGDAIVRLEGVLDKGWIPGELSPKAGNLINHELGMVAAFNSASFSIAQSEYFDFDYFRDQACKLFDVLRERFEIERIMAPSLQITRQRGFGETAEAEDYLRGLNFCHVNPKLLAMLSGVESARNLTVCSEEDIVWQESQTIRRRRFEVRSIVQEQQPAFDDRLMQRVRLLPERQREAMLALSTLRKRHPTISRVAAQFDIETAFESEFACDTFSWHDFLVESWGWHESAFAELILSHQKDKP